MAARPRAGAAARPAGFPFHDSVTNVSIGIGSVLFGGVKLLLYTAPDGAVRVGVLFRDETAWLTQKALAELFGVKVPAINKHLKNIFESGELERTATVSKMEIVQSEGDREVAREVEIYNLDAIIAVGYRVNSYQATQFRIWATRTLREFMIKGFVLDDERLKQGEIAFGRDYFDDLLERIREIRASERRFYQKVTDIYAEGERPRGEAQGRGRVRGLPQAPGCGVRLGLRSRRRRSEATREWRPAEADRA